MEAGNVNLPTTIACWALLGLTMTGDRSPEPIGLDERRAVEIAEKTNLVLGGFPHPIFNVSDGGRAWRIGIMEKNEYAIGHHRFIVIDKRTGKVLRVIGGK